MPATVVARPPRMGPTFLYCSDLKKVVSSGGEGGGEAGVFFFWALALNETASKKHKMLSIRMGGDFEVGKVTERRRLGNENFIIGLPELHMMKVSEDLG